MTVVIVCSDFGAQEKKIWHYLHFPPCICHEVVGLDAIILVFWVLSFKSLQMLTAAMKLKDACSLEEKLGPT